MRYYSNKAIVLTILEKYNECIKVIERALKSYSRSKKDPL